MATNFYLTARPAPYTPATLRGAWDQTTGIIAKAIDSTVDSSLSTNAAATQTETTATGDFDLLLYRGVSGPLAAQTISGNLNCLIAVQENDSNMNAHWHIHCYVTQGDSDTPRGTLLSDYTEALGTNEFPTTLTAKALNAATALSSLAVSQGDRLVVEIGAVARNTVTTSYTATLRYGCTQLDGGFLPLVTGGDGLTRAGYIQFSNTILEDSPSITARLTTVQSRAVVQETATAAVRLTAVRAQTVVGAIPSTSSAVRLTQTALEVLVDTGSAPATAAACTGGGTAPTSSNPSAGTGLSTMHAPVAWMELAATGGTKYYALHASVPIGAFKQARIMQGGTIVRSLSDRDGRLVVSSLTVQMDDTDRELRTLANANQLLNVRADLYVADYAAYKAGATPWRVGSFVVRRYAPAPGLQFELTLEDQFGAIASTITQDRLIPQRTFSTDQFPNLPDTLQGKAEPIAYGSLSDENLGADAQGVVPAVFVGKRVVNSFNWDEYVIASHAIKGVQSWFSGPGAGTRNKMPLGTEGVDFLIPGYSGYAAHVGSSAMYRDFAGRRYTVMYARGPRSDAAREGQIPLALNICGLEDVGDGTGNVITSLPRQVLHFLANFVLGVAPGYLTGAWASIPALGGYSLINADSFETVKTTSEARVGGGYLGAWYLGVDGAQSALGESIRNFALSGDFDFGTNRHGQIFATMVDDGVSPTATYTDVNHVVRDSYGEIIGFDDLANQIVYRYGRRYVAPITNKTPATGDALPQTTQEQNPDFVSADTTSVDGASIAALGETQTYDLTFEAVRDGTIASDVVDHRLTRLADGPNDAVFHVPLSDLGDVDLGDTITAQHFNSMFDTATLRRVRSIAVTLSDMQAEITAEAI